MPENQTGETGFTMCYLFAPQTQQESRPLGLTKRYILLSVLQTNSNQTNSNQRQVGNTKPCEGKEIL